MPAVSKKQQKFFGIVRAIQKGEMAPTTPETAKAAADMKKGDVKKFASTKHKGLPEKKKLKEFVQNISNLKESDFTNITTGNKVGQTFQHATGATITLDGALGGKMMVPSQVTISLPFGEGDITVDGPSESDFSLAGFTKPLDLNLQKRIADQSVEEINDRLDASKEASGAETAKVSDIPSEKTFGTLPSEAEMKSSYEKFREGNPNLPSFDELTSDIKLPDIPKEGWTYDQYIAMMEAIKSAGASAEEPIVKEIIAYSPTGTKIFIDKHGQRNTPIGLIDAQSAITDAVQKALNALDDAWEAYNKVPDLPSIPDEEKKPTGLPIISPLVDKLDDTYSGNETISGIAKVLMKAGTKLPKLNKYKSGVNTMLTYDRFLHNMGKNNSSSSIKGSTPDNRIDITNEISKKDKNYVENELSKEVERTSKDKILSFNNSLEALSKSDTTESDINDAKKTVQDIFAKVYLDKAGLVATFGGTGDPITGADPALPEVLNVKDRGDYYEVDFGKSYAFREGGSEPITKGLLGLYLKTINAEPDTVGSDTISAYVAPAAAKLGITGDKYFKKENDPFSLYNSPDMHYKVTIRIKKNKNKKKKVNESKLSFKLIQQFREESNPRIPRKKGQPANSKKHSDLYTDENPKGTIHGLGFKNVAKAKASVSKIRNSSRSHAHKIQAAVAMEQRAREMGKTSEAAVYRKYINSMKKKTKKMNEKVEYTANDFEKLKKKIGSKKKHDIPSIEEGWSDKYKKSIDCNNPKGFSQKAHCQGRKKIKEEIQTNRKISFPEMQKRIRDAKDKRRNQRKDSEKLYVDTKRRGVKFFDKKGTGRIRDGKKIYD